MRRAKKFFLPVLLVVLSLPLLWLLATGMKMWFHLDFDPHYRSVPGVESIVFWDNLEKQAYARTFWGLKRVDEPSVFSEPDSAGQEDAAAVLRERTDRSNDACVIDMALASPDGKYILYRELAYNFYKSDMTDDEYCYYRVFEPETGKIITIYQGYREWFRLAWK